MDSRRTFSVPHPSASTPQPGVALPGMEEVTAEISRIEQQIAAWTERKKVDDLRRQFQEETKEHYRQVKDLEECRDQLRQEVTQAREELSRMREEATQLPSSSPAPSPWGPSPALRGRASPVVGEGRPSGTVSPARVPAVQPSAFTGKESWQKWFSRFHEDMEYNSWNGTQRLHALRRALRDGPGEAALTLFQEQRGTSYEELVAIAQQLCGQIARDDAIYLFKARKQKRDESLRLYAMDLKKMALEVYGSSSLTTAWLKEELNQRFLQGIYDPELQAAIYEGWRTHMSLEELCELGEHYLKKQLYVPLPTLTVAAVKEEVEGNEEKTAGAIGPKDIEEIIRRVLGEQRRPKKRIA